MFIVYFVSTLLCRGNPANAAFTRAVVFRRCTEAEVLEYIGKIKGLIPDRTDIFVQVNKAEINDLYDREENISSEVMRQKVAAARKFQKVKVCP